MDACGGGQRGGHTDPGAAEALVGALEGVLRSARHLLGALEATESSPLYADGGGRTPTGPEMGSGPSCDPSAAVGGVRSIPSALSPREVGVLRLLAAGHSNRRIAQALCLSPRTVQRHVANAYLKIGARCRAEATAYALDHGLR